MSDKMESIPFKNLIKWILGEYSQDKTIFGIPKEKFFRKSTGDFISLFDEKLETPIGTAAGPHTQLAQNIIAAYLSGGRFFELKTVQIMDRLEIEKPCKHLIYRVLVIFEIYSAEKEGFEPPEV